MEEAARLWDEDVLLVPIAGRVALFGVQSIRRILSWLNASAVQLLAVNREEAPAAVPMGVRGARRSANGSRMRGRKRTKPTTLSLNSGRASRDGRARRRRSSHASKAAVSVH